MLVEMRDLYKFPSTEIIQEVFIYLAILISNSRFLIVKTMFMYNTIFYFPTYSAALYTNYTHSQSDQSLPQL